MKRITVIFAAVVMIFVCSRASFAMSPLEYYRLARKHDDSIHPFAAMVQSAHETGDWTSFLWTEACNGAGLKADKKWLADGGATVSKSSRESSGGSYYSKNSLFRKYSSARQFLSDYAKKNRKRLSAVQREKKQHLGLFRGAIRGARRQVGHRPQVLRQAGLESDKARA